MSTSCCIILKSLENTKYFHRNYDGYPDGEFGIIPILENFIPYNNYENYEDIVDALVNKYDFVEVSSISPFIEYLYVFDEDIGEYITFKYDMEFSNDY